MTEPYLFEKAIGQQMGDLCRLAVGDAKVTQTGEIVTLEDMLGRGAFGVSVEVPYTSGGVQTVRVTRCGKNLASVNSTEGLNGRVFSFDSTNQLFTLYAINEQSLWFFHKFDKPLPLSTPVQFTVIMETGNLLDKSLMFGLYHTSTGNAWASSTFLPPRNTPFASTVYTANFTVINKPAEHIVVWANNGQVPQQTTFRVQVEFGSTATAYEPYNGNTYTITLPATIYGGSINLGAGTVTSRYAADGTELAEPVVTEIDPISIPILAGVNNIWADVGTVTVSYYAADAQAFRPALWYPTIYRGLTSARYLIKRASGAIASFDDAIAAPLVGLRVALPWRSEGWQSVSVTVNGTLTTISLPTTIYGGYLDVVTGQLVATHDENGNLLTNQKLYFLTPTNINALAGVNNVWSDAGDVAVSYRIDNG